MPRRLRERVHDLHNLRSSPPCRVPTLSTKSNPERRLVRLPETTYSFHVIEIGETADYNLHRHARTVFE
jgi:hypothetical protein